MFHKPIYTTLLVLAGFLFSFHKSRAGSDVVMNPGYGFPETLSKTSGHIANQIQIINDILTDSNADNDDDETSSKTKHRLPKPTITFQTKLDPAKQAVTSLSFDPCFLSCSFGKYHSPAFLFGKTRISIALRCLRL